MSNNHKLIPKRRFKEFENANAWEQRKLGEITEKFEYGLNAAATDFDGVNQYLRITDIDDETREFNKTSLTSPDTNLDSAENYILKQGDILFARTGASVGKTYQYKESDGRVYYAGFLIRARLLSGFNVGFIFQNTLTKRYENFISITSQRSGQPGVNAQEYASFKLLLPKFEEQEKIADLFTNLDNLITLHQRKLDKLKETKIAYISEMFPKEGKLKPEKRFKGYKDEWKLINLEQVATMNARIGWQNLRTSEFLKEGDYMLITGTDFDNGKVDFSTCHFVSKERYEQDTNIQVQNGSILITKDGTLGKVAYVEDLEKPATLNAGVFNVRIKDQNKVDGVFLFQYLRAPFLMKYVNGRATGGTIKHLNQNILVKFPILLPEKEEQIKIGKFLTKLDNMIESQQRILSKLIDLKNAYLSEMFV